MTPDIPAEPTGRLDWQKWRVIQVVIFVSLVLAGTGLGWYGSLRFKASLEEAVISSWQQTQLEVVRSVARCITQYVDDHSGPGTSLAQLEQDIFRRFVEPVQLLQNGDAWIYAPDHVVFDLSSDFPDIYRGKSMAEIFEIQKNSGASHYEAMSNDITNAREGQGWYIWLPDKGPEIAAWSPVRFGQYVWTIGLSTPLREILDATGAADQTRMVFMIMGFATLLGAGLSTMVVGALIREHRQDLIEQDNQARLRKTVGSMQVEVKRRMHTESSLLQLNARFNALIQAIPDSVYLKDYAGKYLLVNTSFEKLTGKKSADILGKDDAGAGLPELFVSSPQIEQQVRTLVQIQRFEKKGQSCDGDDCYLEMAVSPVVDASGHITGQVGMIRDVTEIRVAELEYRRLNAQVAQLQKMEAIGALAGGVAHDLNNILTALVSYPELLLLNLPPGDPLRQPLQTIQKAGQMASDIVQDLLILARRGVREKVVLNLNSVVEEYVASPIHQKMVLEHPGIRLRLDLSPDLLTMAGSASDLNKSVMNLVINAYEAMSGVGLVQVSTENYYVNERQTALTDIPEGEYVRLRVSDDGKGIVPELHTRIFEPFFSKKELRRSGSGLGLAVVWGTLQDHGGYVNVLSAPDEGTCFELYFPASRDPLDHKAKAAQLEQLQGAGETVLVVDDVPLQREIATAMLRQLGYSAVAVASGEAALAHVRTSPVDLLLLDMVMEGMDGLDTYRAILALYPEQKAIIASGFSESERVMEAHRLGNSAYIKKPYLIETLAQAVWSALHAETKDRADER